VLAAKVRLGLFEHPYVDEAHAQQIADAPEHRKLARIAAARSAVLLRNQDRLLPLDARKTASIAVIGPLADAQRDVRGPWSLADDSRRAVTVLQGIRDKVPASVRVDYAGGGEIHRTAPSIFDRNNPPAPPPLSDAQLEEEIRKAVEVARRADVAVMVLGENLSMSGEQASRASLDLPGKQQQLLEAVVAAGKPVVLVLVNGRPLNIAWAATHVPAILEAWYPGAEGGNGIADLLFGDATPGGKLTVTWPRTIGQVPIYYAHNLTQEPETKPDFVSRYWDTPTSPLYPFGYGLSYTTFAYSNLRVDAEHGASVDVANTGERAGDEVVQLYIISSMAAPRGRCAN